MTSTTTTATETLTIPAHDLAILRAEYDLNERWYEEAQVIAHALLTQTRPPPTCRTTPWLSVGTYMQYNSPAEALAKFLETQPLKLQIAIGAAISIACYAVLSMEKGSAAQAGKKSAPTDDVLRDRWLKRNPLTARAPGIWRQYEGGVWHDVDDAVIKEDMEKIIELAKREGVRPSHLRLASVHELAKVHVYVPADRWDADQDILVCENGILHIPTGHLMPHTPHVYATSKVPYEYEPDATCPTFDLCTQRFTLGVRMFLQEFAGYCLTTDTRYEIAVWFYGPRGCGKSTVITGFQTMLGERAGVLSLPRVIQSRFGLGNLAGKTLVFAFESPVVYVKATDTINAVISGELVEIEQKYRDPIIIAPRAKILWAMNNLPRVADPGDGLFRRVKIVRFPPLPDDEQDPEVKEQIKFEGAGILNWALEGLERLRARERFQIPQEVAEATAKFQQASDVEAAFVEEMCEVDPQARVQSSVLYQAYRAWCFENGHRPKAHNTVTQDWERLGFYQIRPNNIKHWVGLELI